MSNGFQDYNVNSINPVARWVLEYRKWGDVTATINDKTMNKKDWQDSIMLFIQETKLNAVPFRNL